MTVDTLPRYYVGIQRLRYLLNGFAVVFFTALLGSVGLLASVVDQRGRLTLGVARAWARILLRVSGIRVNVTGLDRLDPSGAYVFVANHTSALDIPALLDGLPYRLRMLAKASLFRIPVLGWYIRRVGYVPVDRDNPRATRRVIREALAGAGRGASIVVFPEGTRSPEGTLDEFKRGAVFLAREAGLPIVPVALVNTGNLMPRGDLRADPGTIELRVGEPLLPDPTEPTRTLSRDIRERVHRLLHADRLR